MAFILNLSKSKNQNLLKAVKTLKKEGDKLPAIELSSGTKVEYTRGANFDNNSFGNRFSLYKEITKPDGTRYVTNANVIGDNVFFNEIFHIKPDNTKKVYSMSPGSSSTTAEIKDFNTFRTYPKILKKLLDKTATEQYSSLEEYISKKKPTRYTSKPANRNLQPVIEHKEPPKLKVDNISFNDIETGKPLELPKTQRHTELPKFDDVIVDDAYTDYMNKKFPLPAELRPKPIVNKVEKPVFTNTPQEDDGWQVIVD